MSTLEDWDKRIAPKLQDIEYCSNTIARYSRYLQNAAQTLPARPAWETKAREALCNAECDLRVALAVVQASQRQYDALQIIAEAAE